MSKVYQTFADSLTNSIWSIIQW